MVLHYKGIKMTDRPKSDDCENAGNIAEQLAEYLNEIAPYAINDITALENAASILLSYGDYVED